MAAVAAYRKGLLWGIAIAFVWRHPSPVSLPVLNMLDAKYWWFLYCTCGRIGLTPDPCSQLRSTSICLRCGALNALEQRLHSFYPRLPTPCQGSYQHGVEFVQSTEESDTIDVSVRVAYRLEKAIEHTVVCLTGNSENEYGARIFVRPSLLFASNG